MAKNDINYFDSFKNMFSFSKQAAAMLNETLKNYDPRELEKKINEIHEVEHGGDNAKHMMMKALSRSSVSIPRRQHGTYPWPSWFTGANQGDTQYSFFHGMSPFSGRMDMENASGP